MNSTLILAVLVLALPFTAAGQELSAQATQQLEAWAEGSEAEPEDDALLQQLAHWRKRPLNLNAASAEDLQVFSFLTPLHIHYFLQYRRTLGEFIDLHELQAIPHWDVPLIRQILPYVQVRSSQNRVRILGNRLNGGDYQLLLRTTRLLQQTAGFKKGPNRPFAGNALHALTRFQYRHPEGLQWGVTTEKDAGEAWAKSKIPSPDFVSAHLFLQRLGKIKALALGDFTINLGQGLVHWQGLAFGKGPATMNIKMQSPVLRPYAAAGENQYLRGAGITLGRGRWAATFFGARQKIDANLDVTESGATVITSFSESGLHRTAAEQAHRRAAARQVWGGSLQYRTPSFLMGLNAVQYRFSLPVQKQDAPYNLYALQGRRFFNISTDYHFTWRNLHFFGEGATDGRGKPALVQGVLASVHPRLDVALHGRLLHRGYTAVAATTFSESAHPANEHGMYTGLQLKLHDKVHLNAYADFFRFPWLRFRVAAPSVGTDYLVQAHFQPAKGTEWYARIRIRNKERDASGANTMLATPMGYTQKNIRVHGSHAWLQWVLRSRVEGVWLRPQPGARQEKGLLCYGELQYHSRRFVDASGRLAFFNTGTYNTRLYAFESDVLYGYSIPPLFGKGWRAYLNVHFAVGKGVDVWLRLAHSYFPGQQSIGSGWNKIEGNERTEGKCQVIFKW